MSSDEPSPKYIFITGGVISSVGKGITTASLGRLLQSRGLSVTVQKLDPYLNVDPGTMSPYQHGEVYVTDDGAETDLDLGHYERFLDQNLTAASSVTMGQISADVIERERRGDYLGGTIQTVPHVTDLVKERVRNLARKAAVDVLIVEVGGTVGDIEGQAFLEAIRQMRYEEPRNGTLAIHVTPLFHLKATNELKTKPTQHSVRTLRSMGIQPDIIVSRTDIPADKSITDKLALFCDVPAEAVMTLETASSIYQVPAILEQAGLTDLTLERLGLTARPAMPDRSIENWLEWTDRLSQTERVCRVAIVGKYVELRDAYLSVKEALIHAGAQRSAGVDITWIQSDDLDHAGQPEIAAALADVDGVIVPGGFGERGIEGEVGVARFALEQDIPYLGLCRGMQNMVIAFARERLDLPNANTTEADEDTVDPVIRSARRATRGHRDGWHDAAGQVSLPTAPGDPRVHALPVGVRLRATPPSLGVQPQVSRPLRARRTAGQRDLARRGTGRDRRSLRSPVHARLAVPSRAQVAARAFAPALPRLHRLGAGRVGDRPAAPGRRHQLLPLMPGQSRHE